MNQLVELDDTPSTRGMIARVHHLVKIEPEKEDTKKGANAA
jgi:ribosomal protein L30/L7E